MDKQTQRVAFTVGDKRTTLSKRDVQLDKGRSLCLIHFGKDKTEQWLLVRIQKPDTTETPNNWSLHRWKTVTWDWPVGQSREAGLGPRNE